MRIFLAFLEQPAGLQELMTRLMNRGGFVVDRAENRIPVGHPGHERKMLTDLDARNIGGDGPKGPPHLIRGLPLRIPSVQLAWSANQEKDDAIDVLAV